jgi:hypothetical protein
MHDSLKIAIHDALKGTEAVDVPQARTPVADGARFCVRAQLAADIPDRYLINCCLRALYREMRQATQVDATKKDLFGKSLHNLKSCIKDTGPKVDHTYAWIAPKARFLKAIIQMIIGSWAIVRLAARMWHGTSWLSPRFPTAESSLKLIGAALAAATVVELAYTLFTDGPDEVLDPLMLGISAFLIIELGMPTTRISWGTGLGLFLTAIALGLLFAIRKRFIDDAEPVQPFWWRRPWVK